MNPAMLPSFVSTQSQWIHLTSNRTRTLVHCRLLRTLRSTHNISIPRRLKWPPAIHHLLTCRRQAVYTSQYQPTPHTLISSSNNSNRCRRMPTLCLKAVHTRALQVGSSCSLFSRNRPLMRTYLVYPGSAHHHATGSRSASTPSGQAYSAHGTMSPPHPSLQQQANTQYVGQHQQAMYPAPGYGYVQHPQSGAVMPPNSRLPPSPASSQVFQTDHLGRRVSASSGHRSASPPSPGIERFLCHKCDKSFSRAHDRKRHYETQHSSHPPLHKCPFCKKEFSRADSLKRHLDNGCEKDPSFTGGSSLTGAS